MIYETAIVLEESSAGEQLQGIKELISSIASKHSGEVVLEDDWGVKTFAQPCRKGKKRGHYYYALYQAKGKMNIELEARLKINEHVLKFMIAKKGLDVLKDKIVKNYVSPFAH